MTDSVKIWDRFIRLAHWSLALCCAAAWISGDEWKNFHEIIGYAAAALVFLRVVWGFMGAGHARFASFVTGPRAALGSSHWQHAMPTLRKVWAGTARAVVRMNTTA